MNPFVVFSCIITYTLFLFFITWRTSKNGDNKAFFTGDKNSNWVIVAYGMIGTSLSGVTFMSIPGWVGTMKFSYLMVVFGYFIGYLIIAFVLMPMYYRLNLTSIYGYLEKRFGVVPYKTGAFYFLLSRTIGAAFRMYLVVSVLQSLVFDPMGISFEITVICFIGLVLLYTFKGGIKTIVWTDMLQTTFMLLALGISIYLISNQLHTPLWDIIHQMKDSGQSQVVFFDWNDKRNWLKQLVSGVFICVSMTGLDQEMMQKNLSCKNISEAQRNMISFGLILLIVNLLFLFLGILLFKYATNFNILIPSKTDLLFPVIALNHLGAFAGVVFVIGLISAAYPSADGALTAMTTSVCVDILNFEKYEHKISQKQTRHVVHLLLALVLCGIIILFKYLNDAAIVEKLFKAAGYTYGPLLGLFCFGFLTKYQLPGRLTLLPCLLAPLLSYLLNENSGTWLKGFDLGFLILPLNGLITFVGLLIIRKKDSCAA